VRPSAAPGEADDLPGFLTRLLAAYARAEAAVGGPIERSIRVAGLPIRLRLAGPALLRPLTRALGHLASAPAPAPSLAVHIWDSDSTGVSLPPPAWHWEQFERDGEIGTEDGRILVSFQVGPGILSVVDRERGLAVYWIKSAALLPRPEIGAPMRTIFQWWAIDAGLQQVHAAAVGLPDGGVLLPGKGGSGKSNTALACLAAGLLYAGDDFCLVRGGPRPAVASLYGTAKTAPDDRRRLPILRAWDSAPPPPAGEKIIYFLDEHVPERLVAELPLRAILIPRLTGRPETRVTPGTPALALAALAPSTMLLMPSRATATFHALAGLVRRLPCFVAEVGTDAGQIAAAIADLLRSDRIPGAPQPVVLERPS
jgi:hypothetical protein